MTADFDDFDLPSPRARRPRGKAAPAAGGRPGQQGGGRWHRGWAFARRYPVELMITVALSGAVGAVAYNALVLQTNRHPAPFFGQGGKIDGPAPLPPARPTVPAVAAPPSAPSPLASVPALPSPPTPMRPAARDGIGDLIRNSDLGALQAPRVVPARPPSLAPVPPAAPSAPTALVRDAIGDLIRFGGGPPPVPPALVGKPDPTRTIAAGQRALAKLGYGSTKADGVMGPGTRQAVERFERDRHLPVTGEFSGRTARELSMLAGIPVE